MAKAIRLRAWQKEALAKLEARERSSFLAVATPGAGKTTFALTAVRRALVARHVRRVVAVVPTQHLKHQWATAAEAFDIYLDPDWSAGDGTLPSDVHGVAVTYQQVAANPTALRRLVRSAFVVLDEIHHAADSRSWGDGVRHAFESAWLRLCMSGTPAPTRARFRSFATSATKRRPIMNTAMARHWTIAGWCDLYISLASMATWSGHRPMVSPMRRLSRTAWAEP